MNSGFPGAIRRALRPSMAAKTVRTVHANKATAPATSTATPTASSPLHQIKTQRPVRSLLPVGSVGQTWSLSTRPPPDRPARTFPTPPHTTAHPSQSTTSSPPTSSISVPADATPSPHSRFPHRPRPPSRSTTSPDPRLTKRIEQTHTRARPHARKKKFTLRYSFSTLIAPTIRARTRDTDEKEAAEAHRPI